MLISEINVKIKLLLFCFRKPKIILPKIKFKRLQMIILIQKVLNLKNGNPQIGTLKLISSIKLRYNFINYESQSQLATVQSMLIDGVKYNVLHFWKAYGMPNKDWPILNSKINFDFYFINWWFEAVCCDINSEILISMLLQKLNL